MRTDRDNPPDEVQSLSDFLDGVAASARWSGDVDAATKFRRAAEWLERFSEHVCAGDIIGCEGGRNCTSDHK